MNLLLITMDFLLCGLCVSITLKGKIKIRQSPFLGTSWKFILFPYVGHINKALCSFQMWLSCLFHDITGHSREQPMQIPRKKCIWGKFSLIAFQISFLDIHSVYLADMQGSKETQCSRTFCYLLLSDQPISVFEKWQQLAEKWEFCFPRKIKSTPVNHMLVIRLWTRTLVGPTEKNAEGTGYFFNGVGPTDSSVTNTVTLKQGEIVAS